MLTVLGGVAQFEREMMLERQREGIAKAKSAGKYKGRKPIAPERQQQVARLAAEGATKTSIARQLGMGEATVSRILGAGKGSTVASWQSLRIWGGNMTNNVWFITGGHVLSQSGSWRSKRVSIGWVTTWAEKVLAANWSTARNTQQ
jgi:hypothetical protein